MADTKISGLTALTTTADEDLLATVDDPAGTPITKKITRGDLIGSATILPAVSDGAAIGSTSKQWSDLFLASGAVINWNNGNVSISHSAGVLTETVDSIVVLGQAGSGGHSLPQIILKSQDTTTPTGAGGFLRFETPNASSVYVDGAQINGGLAVTTAGSEQGDLDLTVYRNGVQKTVALRGDWSAIAPGDDAIWDFGRSAQRFKDGYFSGAVTLGTIELGHASDTTLSRSSAGVLAVEGVVIPSISSTNTLTNKRVTPRVSTTTSSATPTINTDNVDMYGLTAQAADITSFTTNLSGTPTNGQKLWIYIVGTAARAITWGTSFEASTVSLPTTTVSTNRLDVGFVWNAATSKWRCIASA